MDSKNRIDSFDFWKGIACLGVVIFHVKFPNYFFDGIIQSIFRFSVPLFFVISGYFNYNSDKQIVQNKIPAKIKHIGSLCIEGTILYLFLNVMIGLFGTENGGNVVARLKELVNFKSIIVWVIFNQDPFVNILWFLFALLYCYIIISFINKFSWYKVAYISIPILLLAFFAMSYFDINDIWGIQKYMYRNAYFMGMPFFMIGNYIHENEQKIIEKDNEKVSKSLIICGVVISVVEWYFLGRAELFIGSLIMLLGIVLLCLKNRKLGEKSILTKIGRDFSLDIYMLHYAVLLMLGHFERKIQLLQEPIYDIYMWLRIFIVFIISAFLSLCVKKMKNITRQLKIENL